MPRGVFGGSPSLSPSPSGLQRTRIVTVLAIAFCRSNLQFWGPLFARQTALVGSGEVNFEPRQYATLIGLNAAESSLILRVRIPRLHVLFEEPKPFLKFPKFQQGSVDLCLGALIAEGVASRRPQSQDSPELLEHRVPPPSGSWLYLRDIDRSQELPVV
jgi:hypothetical protein